MVGCGNTLVELAQAQENEADHTSAGFAGLCRTQGVAKLGPRRGPGQANSVRRDDGFFPHLYNGNQLGKKEIESVKSSEKEQPGDSWEDALSSLVANGWLVY